MAIISTIGTGKDYTTLQAWEAALPATLTDDEIADCFDEDVSNNSRLYLNGFATAADKRAIIRASAGEQTDYSATGGARLRNSFGATWGAINIYNDVQHVLVQKMKVETGATNAAMIYDVRSAHDGDSLIRVEDCFVIHDNWATDIEGNEIVNGADAGCKIEFENCLFLGARCNEVDLTSITNCTFIGNGNDVDMARTGIRYVKAIRCYAAHFGPTSFHADTLDDHVDTVDLASADTSAPDVASAALADQYTDFANYDWTFKAGNDLEGAGTGGTDIGFVLPVQGTQTIIRRIGSGSPRDYTTLTLWEAAIPANLVTADEQWIGELYNDTEFAPSGETVFTSHTTDATRDIIVRPASGEGFADHADATTNPLVYDQTKGVGFKTTFGYDALIRITNSCDYITIEGLQSDNKEGFVRCKGSSAVIKNNIARAEGDYYGQGVINIDEGDAVNNVIYVDAVGGLGITIGDDLPGTTRTINNTVVYPTGQTASTGIGIATVYGSSHTVANNLVLGFNTGIDDLGASSMTSEYNVTDDSTAPGTNNTTSVTFADQIENTAISTFDARLKTGSDAIDAGVRYASDTDDLDIIGQARSTTDPDIGAWEVATDAGAPTHLITKDIINSLIGGGLHLMSNNYLGDFVEDADVYIIFDTADSTGLSVTATIVVADIEVYRQNTGAIGLTQRSSTTGFTLDVDHDAMTGTHMVAIDTSDNTDAGFFTTGYDYFVKLNTVTVDSISISKWIGHFSIQNRYNNKQEVADLILPPSNTAYSDIPFLLVDETDHVTPETGKTVTATRSIDGGVTFAAATGTVTEVGNGIYGFDATAADMNGKIITFKFSATGCDDTFVVLTTSA